MTRIALLRHFPTDWNLERRLQGRTDRPLSACGRKALARLRLPPGWDGAEIVSSPLSRAAETALALAEGRRVRIDPRLVEIGWGAWEGRTVAELMADPASGFRPTGELGWHDRPPGGESAADAWGRALPALARLACGPGPVVVVAHKALMRVVLGQATGWTGPDAGTVRIGRARLYPLALRPDGWPEPGGEPVRLAPRDAAVGA